MDMLQFTSKQDFAAIQSTQYLNMVVQALPWFHHLESCVSFTFHKHTVDTGT